MQRSYAITWQNGDGVAHSGKLEIRASGVRLEGGNGGGPVAILIPYAEVVDLKAAAAAERLAGRSTLILNLRDGNAFRIASVGSPGILSEVAEEVSAMRQGNAVSAERVAVIVPLRKGKREKAEKLLDKGPPFDPERVGLERHEVFVTDQEAVFVFNAAEGFSLQKLLADSKVWSTAAAWSDVVAGAPRVAKPFFAWATVPDPENLSFEPTPGPGDSEGGDIYSP